jgi:hypothetical protein
MITLVAAVNDDFVLTQNLLTSTLAFCDRTEVSLQRGFCSAGKAYNTALDQTTQEVVVFAHQDVYLPQRWLDQLHDAIGIVESTDPNWAVIGVYGVTANGEHVGHCWSSGLNRILGESFAIPRRVCAIDELVIVLKRSSGLRFDEKLPGFHLYGTDIVQVALANGFSAYVIHAPVVHNSRPVRTLHGAYAEAYHYMRQKWRKQLPISTTVVPLTRTGYPLWRALLRRAIRGVIGDGNPLINRQAFPGRDIARRVGFEVEG